MQAQGKDIKVHGPTIEDCGQRFLDGHEEKVGNKAKAHHKLTLDRLAVSGCRVIRPDSRRADEPSNGQLLSIRPLSQSVPSLGTGVRRCPIINARERTEDEAAVLVAIRDGFAPGSFCGASCPPPPLREKPGDDFAGYYRGPLGSAVVHVGDLQVVQAERP